MKSLKLTVTTAAFVCGLVIGSTAGAQSGLYVDGSGNVGIGTTSPTATLDVIGTGIINGTADTVFSMQRSGSVAAEMHLTTGVADWTFRNHVSGAKLRIRDSNSGTVAFDLSTNGNLTIGGSLTQGSSRAIKTDILPVDDRDILAKVVQLPVFSWRYKEDREQNEELGPMAEDFQETFGLGDGKHISVASSTGISLAAIRGLNQVLTEKEAEIALLKGDNAKFAERLAAIEKQMERLQ